MVAAFEDINPQAPVHVLVVPKKHISTNLDIEEEDSPLVSHIFRVANKIAKDKGVAEKMQEGAEGIEKGLKGLLKK